MRHLRSASAIVLRSFGTAHYRSQNTARPAVVLQLQRQRRAALRAAGTAAASSLRLSLLTRSI